MKNADFTMKKNMKFSLASFIAAIAILVANSFAAVTAGVDYTVDEANCSAEILSANGLKNISAIPFSTCIGAKHYSLTKDIDFGANATSDCETNWNDASAMFSGVFDGNGHTISGICVNATDEPYVHLFNLDEATTIQNVKFSKIYLGAKRSTSTNNFYVSLFKGNTTNGKNLTFSNIQLDNIEVNGNFGSYESYASLLISYSLNYLTFDHVAAKNIHLEGTSSKTIYVGGFIGYHNNSNYSVNISNSSLQGEIKALSTENNTYAGGLHGYVYASKTTINHDTVTANISGITQGVSTQNSYSKYYLYLGGIGGYRYGTNTNLEDLHFKGKIYGENKGSYAYVGGLFGYANFSLSNVSAEASGGYSDTLITGSYTSGYLGGIIGAQNWGSLNTSSYISDAFAKGQITGKGTVYIARGLVGAYLTANLYNSYFIGGIHKSSAYATKISGLGEFTNISNSYAIDTTGNSAYLSLENTLSRNSGLATSLTQKATYFDENGTSRESTLPTEPGFAHSIGFAYAPSINDGFPILPSDERKQTYRILGIHLNDTLYDVYTDTSGKITYKADGSAYTSADFPTWPTGWPEEWKINLSKIYTADENNFQLLSDDDYEISNCTVLLKTPKALKLIDQIDVSACSEPVYKLAGNMDFGENGTSSCTKNWSKDHAKFRGTLDGNGYTISGICQIANTEHQASLFTIDNRETPFTLKNINFANIYLQGSYKGTNKYSSISLFTISGNSEINVSDVNIENVSIEGPFITGNSSAALLFADINNAPASITRVTTTNTNISVEKTPYVGGLIGISRDELVILNSSFNGNISRSKPRLSPTYVGGLVGISITTKNLEIKNSSMKGYISAPNDTSDVYNNFVAYVGGIVGKYENTNSKKTTGITLENNAVESRITANSDQIYAGGHVGYILGYGTLSISSPTFNGYVNCKKAKTKYSYVGALVGYLTNNNESSTELTLDHFTANPMNGTDNTIVASDSGYAGGVIGYNKLPITVKNSVIRGNIRGLYAGAINGYKYGYKTALDSTYYVGNLTYLLSGYKHAIGYEGKSIGEKETPNSIKNSYILDLSGNSTSLWTGNSIAPIVYKAAGYGISETKPATVYIENDVVVSANPKTPKFAWLIGYTYNPSENGGFPEQPTSTKLPIHRVIGISGSDTLYYGFTDYTGKLAYKEDGTSFAAQDYPTEWPDGWKDEWKIVDGTVYTEDFENIHILSEDEAPVVGCVASIKTVRALKNTNAINFPSTCTEVTYKLANDIVVSEETVSSSCTTNWSNTNAIIKGTFDGDGHKISGICINETGLEKNFILNINKATSVKNVSFENIYLNTQKSGGYNFYEMSLLGNSNTTVAKEISNISVNGVQIEGNLKNGKVGLLLAGTKKQLSLDGIDAKNFTINVTASDTAYVGGIISQTDSINESTTYDFSNIELDGSITVSSTATKNENLLVGGIAGKLHFKDGKATFQNIHVKVPINASGRYLYVGGIIGWTKSVAYPTLDAINVHYIGTITTKSILKNNVGGIMGQQEYIYANYENVSAKSAGGSDGDLFTINALGASDSDNNFGGIIGNIPNGKFNTNNVIVHGIFNNTSANTAYHVGGIFGYSNSTNLIKNTIFIGSLPKITYYTSRVYGIGFLRGSNAKVYNSYFIDKAANITATSTYTGSDTLVGLGSKDNIKALVSTSYNVIASAYPKTPAFAAALQMAYEPGKNENYPRPLKDGEKAPVHIMGIVGEDTLYNAYTNTEGKIAYKADGTEFTAADMPDASKVPSGWEISLSTIYTKDFVHEQNFTVGEIDSSGCTISIYSAHALMNIGRIPKISTCSKTTYKLGADIDLGGDGTSNCKNNWDPTYAYYDGTINGNNKTIKGLCLKATDSENLYMFDISTGGGINSVRMTDLYISNAKKDLSKKFTVGLFRTNTIDSTIESKFSTLDINRATIEVTGFTDTTSVGLITGTTASNMTITYSKIQNLNINVDGSSAITVGGLVGKTTRGYRLYLDNDNVSGNITTKTNKNSNYTGGIVGYAKGMRSYKSKVEGDITAFAQETNQATYSDSLLVGGIAGNVNLSTLRSSQDTVKANIKITKGSKETFVGGHFGKVTTYYCYFTAPTFIGSIKVGGVRATSYVGGLYGDIEYWYSSSDSTSKQIYDAYVSSPYSYAGDLIEADNVDYIGGVAGLIRNKESKIQYNTPITLNRATVLGNMSTSISSGYGYTQMGGIVATGAIHLKINNSRYVGKFSKSGSGLHGVYTGLIGSLMPYPSNQTYAVNNSYMIDLGGIATKVTPMDSIRHIAGVVNSFTDSITLFNKGDTIGKALPRSLAFASMLGFTYDNYGKLPIPVTGTQKPVYHILGVFKGDTLYDAYTNKYGQVAYKPDGSDFTSNDLPKTWPSDWPTEWRITTTQIFTQNTEHILRSTDNVDYAQIKNENGEDVILIKTAVGLQNLDEVYKQKGMLPLELNSDIILTEDHLTNSCQNNWNKATANLKTSLNGNGHKISGICISDSEKDDSYVFDIASGTSVENLTLENIYVKSSRSTSTSSADIAIFSSNETSGSVSFANLNIQNVTLENADTRTNGVQAARYGVLFGGTNLNVQAKNLTLSDIKILTATQSYAGALIGYTSGKVDFENNKIKASISPAGYTSSGSVGGLIGYVERTGTRISKQRGMPQYAPQPMENYIVKISGQNDVEINVESISGSALGGLIGTNNGSPTLISENTVAISMENSNYISVGGLIGESIGEESETQQLDMENNVVTGNISTYATTTPTSTCYVGGLLGYAYTKGILLTSNQDRFTGNITANCPYLGGLAGYISTHNASGNATFTKSSFTGTITGESRESAYVGGIVGYGEKQVTINESSARASEGLQGKLIDFSTTSNYSLVKIGGVVGYANPVVFDGASAVGKISFGSNGDISSATDYRYIGGLVGISDYTTNFNIRNSFFIGALPTLTARTLVYGIGYGNSTATVFNSYAAVVNGATSYLWNGQTDMVGITIAPDVPAKIYKDGEVVSEAAPNSPKFANLLQTFAYAPDQNEGYPYYDALLNPTYSVSWVLGTEIISQVYTNGYGKIAYNADGSPVTEASLPPLTSDKYDVFPETWEIDLEKIYSADMVYKAKLPTIVKWMDGNREIIQVTINANGDGILPNGTEINNRTVLKLPQSEKIVTKDSIKYKFWTNIKNGTLMNLEQFIWDADDYVNLFAKIEEPVQFFLDSVTIPKPKFYQNDQATLIANNMDAQIFWNGENFDFATATEMPKTVYYSNTEGNFIKNMVWNMQMFNGTDADPTDYPIASINDFWKQLALAYTHTSLTKKGLTARLVLPNDQISDGIMELFGSTFSYFNMAQQDIILTIDELDVDVTYSLAADPEAREFTIPYPKAIKFNNQKRIYNANLNEIYKADTTIVFNEHYGEYAYTTYLIPKIVFDGEGLEQYGTILQAYADSLDEEGGNWILAERAATDGCFTGWSVTYDQKGRQITSDISIYGGKGYFYYRFNNVSSEEITIKPKFNATKCTRTVTFTYADDVASTTPAANQPPDLTWNLSLKTVDGEIKFEPVPAEAGYSVEIPRTSSFDYNVSSSALGQKLQLVLHKGTPSVYEGIILDKFTPYGTTENWNIVGVAGVSFLDIATIIEWLDEKDSSLSKVAIDPKAGSAYTVNKDNSLSELNYDNIPPYVYRKNGSNYIFVNEKNFIWGDPTAAIEGTYKAVKFSNSDAFNFMVTDGKTAVKAESASDEIASNYLGKFNIETDSLLPSLAAQFITGDNHYQISNNWSIPMSFGSVETVVTTTDLLDQAIYAYGSEIYSKGKINLYMNIGDVEYTDPEFNQQIDPCTFNNECHISDYTTKVKSTSNKVLEFTGYVLDKPHDFRIYSNALIPIIDAVSFAEATDPMIVTQSNDKNEMVNTAVIAPKTIYRLPSASKELNLSLMMASTAESENKVTIADPNVNDVLFRTMASPTKYYSRVELELPRFATLNSCSVNYEVLNEDGSVDEYADIYENADGNFVWNMGPIARDVQIRANITEGDCAPKPYTLTVDADSSDLTLIHFGTKLSGTSENGVTTYQFPANGKWPVAVSAKAYEDYKINFIQFNEEDIDENGQIVITGAENFIIVKTESTKEEEQPEKPDVEINYSIRDIRILPPSGSAVRMEFMVDGVPDTLETALFVRVYSNDTLFTEKFISQNVYNGFNTADIYPLKPGTYYAEIILEGRGASKVEITEEWTIDAKLNIAKAGTWNMMSLANVAEDFKIPESSEGAIYYWDEGNAIGDYMQYRKVRDLSDIQPTVGYWYINTVETEIKRNEPEQQGGETVWDLRNQFSGWNMVANPYSFNVGLGHVANFDDPESDEVFMRWNAETMSYDTAYSANAYEGLWAYTSQDHREVFIYPEPYFEDPDTNDMYEWERNEKDRNMQKKLAKEFSKNSWTLRLVLNGENGLSDAWNVVGVGSREINIDEPPAPMEGGVNLSIENGNRILAKSIKRDITEASWNLGMNAATQQKGSIAVEGLDKLSEAGLYASLVMDNKVYPLTAGESIPVDLSTVTKTATLKISENPAVQLALGISALHFKANGNQLMVNFNLNESKSKYADIRLLDARGNVVSSAKELATAGGHSVSLQKPTATGIYVLRIVVGNEGKQIKIKL